LLKERGLLQHLKMLANYPDIGYHLHCLLAQEMRPDQAYHLAEILKIIPSADRFATMCKIVDVPSLKVMLKSNQHWPSIESAFDNEHDRSALNKLVYSPEDLAAKDVLKNIETTIKRTKWSFGFFDSHVTTNIGQDMVDIPESVRSHVDELRSVAYHQKSPADALHAIKTQGQIMSHSGGIFTLLVGKSDAEKYFDNFASEETFRNAFVIK